MSVMKNISLFLIISVVTSCSSLNKEEQAFFEISKENYQDQLEGYWLGQLIANWTGLITENDKIGNIGEIKTGEFYTREDWGKTDQRSIWEDDSVDKSKIKIDYVLKFEDEIWGSDDDTDIEYMYQYLQNFYDTNILTSSQIREGWLRHIYIELEVMVESGFSNLEAIKSATVNPAKFFGLENKEGRIKNGYKADLVILNSNPLDNIRNTQDISSVIKNGEFLSKESLDSLIYKN